jgi:hypothetical protein
MSRPPRPPDDGGADSEQIAICRNPPSTSPHRQCHLYLVATPLLPRHSTEHQIVGPHPAEDYQPSAAASWPPPSRSSGPARGEGAVLLILVAQDLPSANQGAARRRSSSSAAGLQALAGNEGSNFGRSVLLDRSVGSASTPTRSTHSSTMIAGIQGKHE